MEWNGLIADKVVQATGAPIRLLQRGVFAGMHNAYGVRWALSRISSIYVIYLFIYTYVLSFHHYVYYNYIITLLAFCLALLVNKFSGI